jgi:hypothetical protein
MRASSLKGDPCDGIPSTLQRALGRRRTQTALAAAAKANQPPGRHSASQKNVNNIILTELSLRDITGRVAHAGQAGTQEVVYIYLNSKQQLWVTYIIIL